MKLFDNFWNYIANTKRVKEFLTPEFSQASGAGIDSDDHLFRRISQTQRDMEPLKLERAVNISLYMYNTNPLAQRIIDVPMQAIESAGIEFDSKDDDRLQELWDDWWGDGNEGFSAEFFELFKDGRMTGEIHWPVAINAINGALEFGYIDPINVKQIFMVPGNVKQADKVILKDNMLFPNAKQVYTVIRRVGDVMAGELIHVAFNKLTNASRGVPVLAALLDWLDLYDQGMINEAERWSLLKSFLYHVTIEDGDEEAINKFNKMHFPGGKPMNPGSVLTTNEKIKMEAVTPDLKAGDSTEMSELQLNNIESGAGLMGFVLQSGKGINQGVAREIVRPSIWMIESIQRKMTRLLTTLFKLVVQNAENKGRQLDSGMVDSSMEKRFKITANEVLERDLVVLSTTLKQLTEALIAGKSNALIDDESARKAYVNMASKIDESVNLEEVERNIEEQEKEKPEVDIDNPGDNGNLTKKDDEPSFETLMRF